MTPAVPQIGFGEVRHTRLRPVFNAFAYPTFFLMLPLRTMSGVTASALPRNRRGLVSFHDTDHGDGRGPERGGALAWVDELLRQHGIADATGEVWLHCYPRVFGITFKPVSLWYCHADNGELRAVVAEVNNTFGERHCYLLDSPRYGAQLRADKVFHVSPFCKVEGHYLFRFLRSEARQRTVVRIDYEDLDGPLIRTSVSGKLEPLTRQALSRALWRHPALTLGVVARIHWQAARLWLRRVPFFSKPRPPDTFVTRS